MCNDYEQHVVWAEYCKMMQALELDIPTQQSELDLPQADDIRINDLAPVMRAAGNGIELAQMRFGFPPSNPRGGRQVAVLQPKDWRAWIELTEPEPELLKPLPGGSLRVETVRPASD